MYKFFFLLVNSILLQQISSVNVWEDGEAWSCNINPLHSVPSLSSSDLQRINKLEQIQLFFRHGLRLGTSPLTSFFPLVKQPTYTCNIITVTSRITSKHNNALIPLQMRKIYVENEQLFPSSNCEWTQCTFNGFIQMQNHADMIYDAYIGNEAFKLNIASDTNLPLSHYFTLHSTDYDRTIGSTYSFMISLLKNVGLNTSNWNDWDLKLKTHDKESDPYMPHDNERCKAHPQFVHWKEIYAADPNIHNDKYEQEYMQSDYVVNTLNNYIMEGGIFPDEPHTTAALLQYPYCNSVDIPLSHATFFKLDNFSYFYNSQTMDVSTEYARNQRYCYEHTFVLPVLNEYKKAMDRAMMNGTDKIVIHASHLATFKSLLQGLNLPNALDPPAMGEMLIFELYSAAENDDSYFFRFIRKGKTLKYPYCDYSNATELCDLEVLMENDFMDVVNMSVWENEVCGQILDRNRCGYNHSNVNNATRDDIDGEHSKDKIQWKEKTFYAGILIGFVIGILASLIVLCCVRYCINKKNESLIKAEKELHTYQSTKNYV